MIRFVLRLLLTAGVFLGVSHFLPGFHVDTFQTALLAAVVFGLMNALVKPILVLLTLPVTFLTLGLFLLVINAVVMGLTAYLVPGFSIAGMAAALAGWLLVSVGSWMVSWLLKSD